LTPKTNGPDGDFFSDEPHRRHDAPAGVRQRKPLSQILREEREHRNVSLQEVAKLTRIPLNYLQLLEGEGDKRLVPDSLYLIASLRSYVAFLNINPGAALTRFIAELEQGAAVEEKAGGSVRPSRSLNSFPQQWPRALPRTIILLLSLGILAIIGYYSELTQEPRPKDDTVAPRPSSSASPPTSPAEPAPLLSSPAPSASPPEADQVPPSASPSAESPPVAVAPQAEPPAAAASRVEAPGRALHRLGVQAKAKTWLHVTIDDQPMKRLFLRPGQAVEWSAEQGFTLSLGNAGGVKLTLDGQALPPLGKAGQMVRNIRLPSPRGGQDQQGRSTAHPPASKPRSPISR